MIKYLIRTAVVAVVGCALLWFGLPILKSVSPSAYYGLAANLTGHAYRIPGEEENALAVPFWRKATKEEVAAAEAGEDPAALAVATPDLREALRTAGEKVAKSAKAGVQAATDLVDKTVENAGGGESAPEPVDEGPDPRAATNEDPGYGWGVLVHNADFFNGKMKKLGSLPAGTVIEHMTKVQKPEGEVVSCRVLRGTEWAPRAVVFFTADLVMFDAPVYAEADRRTRDAIIDYFIAAGRLEQLEGQNKPKRGNNPYEAEYRAAKEKHDAFQREVNEVNAKIRYSNTHNLPGGPSERARLMQRGREMRTQQVAVEAEFKPIRDKWTSWERAHPEEPVRAVRETPEMRKLKEQMEHLYPTVAPLCPGI